MLQVYSCLVHEHDFRLLTLAALVCSMAAFTVFMIVGRGRLTRNRIPWAALAGSVCGVGTWATHFVAMLAYNPGIPVHYDPLLTLVSGIAAVVIAGAGWWLVLMDGRYSAVVGGSVVAIGTGVMHYTGMAAVRTPGVIVWDYGLVAASILASLALTNLALWEHCRRSTLIPWRPALILVFAISSQHFVGMGAVRVYPSGDLNSLEALDPNALAALVMAGSVLVVALGFFIVLYDRVTEREKLARRIAHLAYHDSLTGLSNRSVLEQHLPRAVDNASRNGNPLAVICVDLDGFKAVNDTHGHAAGDELLVAVANRLRCVVRRDELVARTGGDEFIIVQEGGMQPAHASLLSERVLKVLEEPFGVSGKAVLVGASVGVAVFPRDASTSSELLKKADAALYQAKSGGRNTMRFFDAAMERALQQRRRLETDLPIAIREGQFKVHYQPIANVSSGSVIGFEALLRWDHPELGPIDPETFIRVAEGMALISELGKWVLLRACREAASWPQPMRVSVNFSPTQFQAHDLVDSVASVLAETGLDATRLDIEVTESVLIAEPENTLSVFKELRRMGAQISLDDFGTGYSSLNYFQVFPFDKLKIDRCFIANMSQQSPSREIVSSVIDLARKLGITVIAEGVESADQLEMLREMRCPHVQGYLIGRPNPIGFFEETVSHRSITPARAA